MHAPHISVVVPNHNYGRFLDRFFGALAAQTFSPDAVEVVFVDDASSDDSVRRARRWQADGPWAAFRVLALPRVGRPGPVRNAGAKAARGSFLLFCDPDDYLAPDFLRHTHAALTEPCGPDEQSCAPGPLPGPHIACADYIEESPAGSRVVRVPDFHPNLLRTQNLFPTTSLMRREVWQASRGFRTATAYEDWDFWVQAAMAGFGVVRVAQPLLHYVFHDANYSHAARANDGRAKARIVRDNPSFFESEVRAWARALLCGEPWAVPFTRGVIPRAADIRALRELFVARMGAVRAGEIFSRAGL
uniref:Glycosyl transferase family 2 n=1 Tax=Nitratidesulfovibrio vulgaris (strain DSM 19637 / Miyazaki F) TaxID=883 RepID=B8DQH4_NITV9